jgi:hypothetical protein
MQQRGSSSGPASGGPVRSAAAASSAGVGGPASAAGPAAAPGLAKRARDSGKAASKPAGETTTISLFFSNFSLLNAISL